MDIESQLRERLIEGVLPSRTRSQVRKTSVVNEMVQSILPFLRQEGEFSFSSTPSCVHLRNMIQMYEKWKSLYNYSDVDCYFQQNLLRYLLKICHYWQIDDFFIPDKVFPYYQHFYGDFKEIIHGIIDEAGTWKRLFQWGMWLKPPGDKHRNVGDNSPLAYYLFHYNYMNYGTYNRYFANEPVMADNDFIPPSVECFLDAKPKELILLLQYGGTFSGTEHNECEAAICYQLISQLIDNYLTDVQSVAVSNPAAYCVVLASDYWKDKLLCATLLTRVAPQAANYCSFQGYENVVNTFQSVQKHVNDFPDFTKIWTQPCSLKHICRLKIRCLVMKSFACNSRLPIGIQCLPLPSSIKDYLNLLAD